MKRFKNILLVAGGKNWEKSTLKRAVTLAKNNRAQLKVVEVIEELPHGMGMLVTVMLPLGFQEISIKERRKQLEQFISPIQQEGIRISVNVLVGKPFIEVIREVLRNRHDLVIMTAEGKGGPNERLFGSTSMRLMRKCPCPVWVMKTTRSKRYVRILAAVDPDPSDDVRDALNTKIMDLATSLACQEKCELHVVHAWTLFGEKMLGDQVKKSQSEVENEHTILFDKLLGKYALENLNHRVHLLKGEAGTVIPELAAKKQVDLIVMGTVCRIGLAGFFIGNTAENVLQQVDCSVLTVKPDGFVTPVKLPRRERVD